jgi:Cys-tRNA(Pro)/Cys-tRNA(Cys) deacylase
MAPTPAVVALERAGVVYTLHTYDHDPSASSYGAEAADALGVDPNRVFKTLVASTGPDLVVGVVPVVAQLDLKALAGALGAKRAVMAEPADAERATGYVLGGISPLGQRRRLRTVIDASATSWPTVFCSGGRRGLEIELAPGDLARATAGRVAAIARRP